MPTLKLQYLPMHGRAEAIRMFLHYCDLEFYDEILEFDVFARTKDAKMLPYDQVPVLYVDEEPIAQTGSILRYLSRISGHDGDDPVRSAKADSAFEAAQEMPMAQIYVAVNLMEETEVRESAKAFQNSLPEYLVNWSKVLGSHKFFHVDMGVLEYAAPHREMSGPGRPPTAASVCCHSSSLSTGPLHRSILGWSTILHMWRGPLEISLVVTYTRIGDSRESPTPLYVHALKCETPGYADFFIWSLLDIGRQLVSLQELLKDHTNLRTWSATVKKLPAVAMVLSKRSKIRDLSRFKL